MSENEDNWYGTSAKRSFEQIVLNDLRSTKLRDVVQISSTMIITKKDGTWRGVFPCLNFFQRRDYVDGSGSLEHSKIFDRIYFRSRAMDDTMDKFDSACFDERARKHVCTALNFLGSDVSNIIWNYDPRLSDLHLRLKKFSWYVIESNHRI